jgi:hypothetical protein
MSPDRKKNQNTEAMPDIVDGVSVEGSLWLLIPKAATGIALSVIIILARFWFEFGEIPMFAVGFCVFVATLQILLIVGLRFVRRTEVYTIVEPRNDWIDKVGAWWLMACAFGALFGWLAGTMAVSYPEQWRIFYLLKTLLTIFLPIATMVPNLRYISRNAAYIQVPILVSVTILPILVGLGSVFALWTGVNP